MSRANQLFGQDPYNRSKAATTQNKHGQPAFDRDLKHQYLQMVMTNMLGNTYYTDQQENVKQALDLHRAMLKADPEFMAKAIVYARNHGYTRLQPIIGLVFLSTIDDKRFFHAAFPQVIFTPGNVFDFTTIAGNVREGRGFGRTVKKALSKWFNSLSEYHVIKHGAETKMDPKTRVKEYDLKDLLKLVRPIPLTKRNGELFKYILGKEVEFKSLPQVDAFEKLKVTNNLTEARALIEKGRIPHEVATGVLKSPDVTTWEFIMKQMPYFALLRNLNTLTRHKVFEKKENIDYVVARLTDREAVLKSKILPFRFHTAIGQAGFIQEIRDALFAALNISFANVPKIGGETHISIDLSGSMRMINMREIATIFGVAAWMNSERAELTAFDTELYAPQVSRMDSLMTNVAKFKDLANGGTALSIPITHLMGGLQNTLHNVRNGYWDTVQLNVGYHSSFPAHLRGKVKKVDNIVIITDEQENRGKLLIDEFAKYRRTVNKDAKLFMINVGQVNKYAVPQDEPNVYQIYGWSDQVLQFISMASQGMLGQVEYVESLDLNPDVKSVLK